VTAEVGEVMDQHVEGMTVCATEDVHHCQEHRPRGILYFKL
jgi:hypothetical protein